MFSLRNTRLGEDLRGGKEEKGWWKGKMRE